MGGVPACGSSLCPGDEGGGGQVAADRRGLRATLILGSEGNTASPSAESRAPGNVSRIPRWSSPVACELQGLPRLRPSSWLVPLPPRGEKE